MKKLLLTLVAAATLTSAQADLINGFISFGSESTVTVVGGFGTPTGLTFQAGPNAEVEVGYGDFAPYVGNGATFYSFDWIPNDLPVVPVWELAGLEFSFDLESLIVVSTAEQLKLSGKGTVNSTLAGFDPTPGDFEFTINNAGGNPNFTKFAWSSSASVPDSGTTLALLGGAMGLLGLARRKMNI